MSNLQEQLNALDNGMTSFYQMEFQFHLITQSDLEDYVQKGWITQAGYDYIMKNNASDSASVAPSTNL